MNFLWKRNRRGRQGTAFRDAWQTRLFRLGWRLESASITKYVERKTNVYLRSLSGEAPTYLVSTHFCSSVHSFRRLPPATQLQLEMGNNDHRILFTIFPSPPSPSLSYLRVADVLKAANRANISPPFEAAATFTAEAMSESSDFIWNRKNFNSTSHTSHS